MGITAKIIKKGNSLDKIRANVNGINGEEVQIGYFSEQGNHSSGLSYATLMAIQEFGTDDIPSRPVFQIIGNTKLPQKDARVKSAIRNWSKGLLGSDNSGALLDAVGISYQEALVSLFGSTSVLAPNDPKVAARKGRDEPLVDTGELRDNLGYRTSKDKSIKT